METLGFVPIISFGLGVLSAVAGVISAGLVMRAKTRAKVVLSHKAELSRYRRLADKSKRPSLAEIDRASDAIVRILDTELSKDDQRRVYQGLHQSNKVGEWRFISELLH
jgi:hypothetical protein